MPLDLDCTDPMYLLGRVVAAIEGPWPNAPRARVSDGPELDVLLVQPAKGFALLRRRFGDRMSNAAVSPVIEILPAQLPKGPMSIEDQGPYWLGYYHQRGQDQRDLAMTKRFDAETVRRVGEALFGPDHWQSGMARALGISDTARVRQWVSESPTNRRKVPPGVCRDLLAMLRQNSAETKALADEIDAAPSPEPSE